jgi:thiol-disulfide isomerase/thioredoxin
MKKTLFALLYTATAALANPALADLAAAEAAREGDMKKLIFAAPKPAGTSDFATFEGAPLNLSDWQGKWVLLNFWATWCAPCRKEMPMLSELQVEFGGDTFEVVTVATSRNPPQAMKAFFAEIGVTNLPLHVDPKSVLAREMAVLGLPVTVILDPDGNEVARLRGDADWASDSAKAVIRALTEQPES